MSLIARFSWVLGAAFDGSGLTSFVRTVVGNLFLAAVGAGAIAFLFRREFVRFAEFMALAVLVATFIYVPEIWKGLAETVARAFGS